MKKLEIISFTEDGTFILEEAPNCFRESSFEGFQFQKSLSTRHKLTKHASIEFEGSINKTNKCVRYLNQQFFQKLIQNGAASVIESQLNASKIYSSEQKAILKKKSSEQISQNSQDSQSKVVNLLEDRKAIPGKIKAKQLISARLEYLSDEIILSYFDQQDNCVYLPIKLKYIDHCFTFLPRVTFGSFLKKYQEISVTVDRVYFNLDKFRYEVQATVDDGVICEIIGNGWGVLSPFNLCEFPNEKIVKLREAEQQAKKKQLGIYQNPFEMLGLVYTKNSMVGIVEDVFNGFNFSILMHGAEEPIKVQLSSIYCPVGDEPGAFECMDFARKQLIGKEVNVFLKKTEGLNVSGSISRVSDSKDIEQMMLQNGWAFVKDNLRTSLIEAKKVSLEQKVRQNHKGLHRGEIGIIRMTDLTTPNVNHEKSHLEKRLEFLNKCAENEEGVIENILNEIIYYVRIESKKTIIKVKLQGVLAPRLSDAIPQYAELRQTTKKFLYQKFTKRNVKVILHDYERKNNEFIGTIKLPQQHGKSFQQLLLEESLVYCDHECVVPETFTAIQNKRIKEEKGVWQPKLSVFRPRNPLDNYKKEFKGKFSWVVDGQKVYIQPKENYKALDNIFEALNHKQLKTIDKSRVKPGLICASEYCGDIYRARVVNVKKNKVLVKYIDWGNEEQVLFAKIYEINLDLHYIPPLSFKACLNLVRKFKHAHSLEVLRKKLLNNEEYLFRKAVGDMVDAYKQKSYLNYRLIQNGSLKMDRRKIADYELLKDLESIQEKLREKKIGIWQLQQLKKYQEDSSEEQLLS